MAHAWKACWGNTLGGSNPPSSANRPCQTPKKVTVASRSRIMHTRRDVVRRHRRERQFLVFGLTVGVLVALIAIALAAYQGRITWPIDAAFKTPAPGFSTDVTVPCPPVDKATGVTELPLPVDQVVVRVRNGTTTPGLARDTLAVLTGRGYRGVGATNWDNRTYADSVRIQFGADGLQQAYTVGRNFPTVEYVLDNRKGAVVDIIVGATFGVKNMRPQYAPELDVKTPLVAPLQCFPADRITPQPAPHIIPVDPLAPTASPTPTPSPSPSPSA
jgi:LytR cell envelope-related transcriptional attenuator